MVNSQQQTAFETLLQPHMQRLYRLAWRLTGQKAEAEDLFQELLTKAFGKLDDLVKIDEPGPWLCRMMYNLFIDERRRFARRRLHVVDEGALPLDGIAGFPGDDDPELDQVRRERLQELDRSLAQLSEEHRTLLLLHDTEGYKMKEIQALIGVPIGTIKSRLHRARAQLRKILESSGTFF